MGVTYRFNYRLLEASLNVLIPGSRTIDADIETITPSQYAAAMMSSDINGISNFFALELCCKLVYLMGVRVLAGHVLNSVIPDARALGNYEMIFNTFIAPWCYCAIQTLS